MTRRYTSSHSSGKRHEAPRCCSTSISVPAVFDGWTWIADVSTNEGHSFLGLARGFRPRHKERLFSRLFLCPIDDRDVLSPPPHHAFPTASYRGLPATEVALPVSMMPQRTLANKPTRFPPLLAPTVCPLLLQESHSTVSPAPPISYSRRAASRRRACTAPTALRPQRPQRRINNLPAKCSSNKRV